MRSSVLIGRAPAAVLALAEARRWIKAMQCSRWDSKIRGVVERRQHLLDWLVRTIPRTIASTAVATSAKIVRLAGARRIESGGRHARVDRILDVGKSERRVNSGQETEEFALSGAPDIDGYTIERVAGRGATAVVYAARERKHGRMVALKVLRADLAASLHAERFLREIDIIAGLSHPNILPLLNSGRTGDRLYYVTPFVSGESLRSRLERERQLGFTESVGIVREVAEALDYAHRRGVVHRDIKPENILLADGHAVVADFGIAMALSLAGDPRLTADGLTIGTAPYMSPEQAGGESEIDGRSDVYALGCVLYELLGGSTPFVGVTARQILAQQHPSPVKPRLGALTRQAQRRGDLVHRALLEVAQHDHTPIVRRQRLDGRGHVQADIRGRSMREAQRFLVGFHWRERALRSHRQS